MNAVSGGLFLFGAGLCGLASVLYVVGLSARREPLVRAAFVTLALAVPAWTAALGVHVVRTGRLPLGGPGGGVGPWDHPLAATAWALLLAVTVVGVRRDNARVMGAFVAPVAVCLAVGAVLFGGAGSVTALLPEVLSSAWFPVHIGSIYLSISLFALAFGASVVYLLQHKRLKAKLLGPDDGIPLPSLEAADRIAKQSFVAGLVALTLGILAGILWYMAEGFTGTGLRNKVLITVGIWFVYLVGWQARGLLGWTARRTAWVTIFGFVVLLLSTVGVRHA